MLFVSFYKFIQVPTTSIRRSSDNTTGRTSKRSDDSLSPQLSTRKPTSVSWQNLDKQSQQMNEEFSSTIFGNLIVLKVLKRDHMCSNF